MGIGGRSRSEIASLDRFEFAGRTLTSLSADFINDVHPDGALALAEETGATYPSIADPGGELMVEVAFAVARRGLPAFVFVDEDGVVVAQDSGGVDSVAEIKAKVAEHLGIGL